MTASVATSDKIRGARAIAWLLLIAFTLQSFITQTHIHGVFGADGGIAIVKALENPHKTKAPTENTADCPFCQAITHAGAFFAPSASTLILRVIWAKMLAPILISAATDSSSSHPWQSRAPPQH